MIFAIRLKFSSKFGNVLQVKLIETRYPSFDCPYGPRDIIHDGVDGFVVDNRDINQFAEKVCILMGNHDLRVKMGKEGIKSSSRYKDTKIMPKWVQLFQSLKE